MAGLSRGALVLTRDTWDREQSTVDLLCHLHKPLEMTFPHCKPRRVDDEDGGQAFRRVLRRIGGGWGGDGLDPRVEGDGSFHRERGVL